MNQDLASSTASASKQRGHNLLIGALQVQIPDGDEPVWTNAALLRITLTFDDATGTQEKQAWK